MKKLNNKISVAGVFLFCTIVFGFVFVQNPLNLRYIPDGGDPPPPPPPRPFSWVTLAPDQTCDSGDTISLTWRADSGYGSRWTKLERSPHGLNQWTEVDSTSWWSNNAYITYTVSVPYVLPGETDLYDYRVNFRDSSGSHYDYVDITVHGEEIPLEFLIRASDTSLESEQSITLSWSAESSHDLERSAQLKMISGDIIETKPGWDNGISIDFTFNVPEIDLGEIQDVGYKVIITDSSGSIEHDVNIQVSNLPEWTVLFYLDGDLDDDDDIVYDGAKIKDEILENEGSSEAVNLVSLLDLKGEKSRYQYYQPDHTILIDDDHDDEELNMGLVSTLEDFIIWGQTNYPAENYLLILFDHGMGIMNGHDDSDRYTEIGGVCYDGDDYLTPNEIKLAITDKNIAILGMDACLMGSTEVHYALRDEIQYFVASEEVSCAGLEDFGPPYNREGDIEILDDGGVPSGWPYDTIVQWLKDNPTESPETIANEIVTLYDEAWNIPFIITFNEYEYVYDGNRDVLTPILYEDVEVFIGGTLSNVKSSDMEDIQFYFALVCEEMIDLLPDYPDKFYQARSRCQPYYAPHYIDLWDLLDELSSEFSGMDLSWMAQGLKIMISNAVKNEVSFYMNLNGIYELADFSHGMSLYFPNYHTDNEEEFREYWSNYADTKWSTDTNWTTFLNAFCQPLLPIINSPDDKTVGSGSSNNQITWIADSIVDSGGAYEIYINGALQCSGVYVDDDAFIYIYTAPIVSAGHYLEFQFKCRVSNKYAGYTEDIVVVTVYGDY